MQQLMPRLLTLLAIVAAPLACAQEGGGNEVPLFPVVKVETSHGDFTLTLDGQRAPLTVVNFMKYVQSGHYEGTIFHRVIPGFMAQAGGYDAEFEEKETLTPVFNESGNGRTNRRGTIAMARTSDPHSGTSQFYINLVNNDALNPNPRRWGYCVFGEVTEGMETLDAIAEIPTGPRGPFGQDVPQTTVTIEKMTLTN